MLKMKEIDIENFRLDGGICNVLSTKPQNEFKPKIKKYYQAENGFIAAMPLDWIAEASNLPGHALHVALAIMYLFGMKRGKEVVLTRYHFDIFNTARGPVRRGLDALQQAGLIKYTKDGQKYRVTVLLVESQADETARPDNSK